MTKNSDNPNSLHFFSFNTCFRFSGGFGDFIDQFDKFYVTTDRTLTAWLQMVKNYPITEKYMQFVDQLVKNLKVQQC